MTKKLIFMVTFFLLIGAGNVLAQELRTVKTGSLAAVSEEWFDRAAEYIRAQDGAALKKLVDARIIFLIKPGSQVYIVDTRILSDKVKIRQVGEVMELWTINAAFN